MAKVHYTKEQVNQMRMTKTDIQVALDIGLEKNSITRLYWTRSSNNLPYLWDGKSRSRDKRQKFTSERVLETDKWEYNEVKEEYEWEIVQIWMRPAWFTRFNQNSLWQNS